MTSLPAQRDVRPAPGASRPPGAPPRLRRAVATAALLLALAAPTAALTAPPTADPPPVDAPASAPVGAPADAPADAPVALSSLCARCHASAPRASALRDAAGRAIGPHDLWRGSPMANAAVDPLWRAVLSAEIDALPSRAREIEATCLGCHAPMAARTDLDDHGTGSLLHLLACDGDTGALARDGVSCTVCHGMSPEGLGTPESFSAGFVLDAAGRMSGPHERPFTMPMRHHTGFTPAYGAHVTESALCGSCHTLETPVFDEGGRDTGARFLEQAPYLEWRNSAYDTERAAPGPDAASCADCHVPVTDEDGLPITTRIARNPGGRDFPPVRPRAPVGRHVFVGGNTLLPALLRDHGEALGATAPAEAFQATLDATREQLATRTAALAVEDVRRDAGRLLLDVVVTNLAGHKLPTAHPTRRVWLSVVVRDAAGAVVFASGVVDASGRLLGANGEPLPSELAAGPLRRHVDRLVSGDEVASWEAVMADVGGRPVHTLVRGADWWRDDRLLPAGWAPDHAEAARTAPTGVAGDADFRPGSDTVHVDVAVPDGPLTVEVALLHQTLGARWLAELLTHDTPEVQALWELLVASDRTPDVLATARADA